jgi:hypothetical protein
MSSVLSNRRGVERGAEVSARLEWKDFQNPAFNAAPENVLGACMWNVLFGLEPQELARACESAIWSPTTRLALKAQHAGVLAAHQRWPECDPRTVENIHRFYTGLTFSEAAAAVRARVREVVQSTTQFGAGLANVLNRVLITAMTRPSYGEESIATPMIVRNFRSTGVVAVSRVADLPTVLENGDYTESAALSTVVASAAPIKHGVIETITFESLRNDDIGVIRRRVEDLGQAGRRTLAKAIWNHWVSNTVYAPDSGAWFSAGHNNTGTTALTAASLKAALLQLEAQPAMGTTEKLGLPLRYPSVWLVVPPALIDTACALNQSTVAAESWAHGLFGPNNEHIIVLPFTTDANDWGVHYDASLVESIRVLHLDRQEPEIVLSQEANAGGLFLLDRIQYRVSHTWGTVLANYRGATKNVVA